MLKRNFLYTVCAVAAVSVLSISICAADTPNTDTIQTERIDSITTAVEVDEKAKLINESLDAMVTSIVYHDEHGYFGAYKDDLAKITALGEDAVPYLLEIGECYSGYGKYTTEQTRCFLALAAAYRISPDSFDMVSVSPDGELEFRAKVDTFFTLADNLKGIKYKDITVTRKDNGTVVYSGPLVNGVTYTDGIYNVTPTWSPDSKYLTFSFDKGDSFGEITCISIRKNAQRSTSEYWPHNELFYELKGKLRTTIGLVGINASVKEWKTSRTAIVDVAVKYMEDGETKLVNGSYTYNVPTHKYRGASFGEPVTIGAGIKKIIDKNLEILISDTATNSYTHEKQFIDAHPEAFDEIVALGSEAIPYLKAVIEKYPLNFGCANYLGGYGKDYKRTIMATAAIYEIEPSIYDLVYPSPNGKYELRAAPTCFYHIGDPFKGTSYKVSMKDRETGEIFAAVDGYTNLMTVYWSADSRFAAVAERLNSSKLQSPLTVYRTDTKRAVPLPYGSIISDVTGGQKLKRFGFDIGFGSWVDENRIKVTVTMNVGKEAFEGTYNGYYIYDLSSGGIIEKSYTYTKK